MFKSYAIQIRITHQTVNTKREINTLDGSEVKLNWKRRTVISDNIQETTDPHNC